MYIWPCPPVICYLALVLLSWVIEEINAGWSAGGEQLLMCSLPAFIRVLSHQDGEMWEGEYEVMEGLPLLQKQTRTAFYKWARWLCLNGAETWVGSRHSAKVRCGHLKQQLIHLGGITELGQNMILSRIIVHPTCVFANPQTENSTPVGTFVLRAFIICVSTISTMNLQSLHTFPHNGVNCNCLQMHFWPHKENSRTKNR